MGRRECSWNGTNVAVEVGGTWNMSISAIMTGCMHGCMTLSLIKAAESCSCFILLISGRVPAWRLGDLLCSVAIKKEHCRAATISALTSEACWDGAEHEIASKQAMRSDGRQRCNRADNMGVQRDGRAWLDSVLTIAVILVSCLSPKRIWRDVQHRHTLASLHTVSPQNEF